MLKKILHSIKRFWIWLFSKTTLDEKAIEIAEETKIRVKAVAQEAKDVKNAVKEVGNQIEDIADAAKGKKRRGRKPKSQNEKTSK